MEAARHPSRNVFLQLDTYDDYLRHRCYILGQPAEKRRLPKEELDEIYSSAIDIFNRDPKKAIAFLAEKHVMEGSPVETAHFLIDFADYLSKSRLGDFISGVEEFNQCVCAQVMTRWYFKRLRIDEALRRLVKYVKLPNESQQIDRILEKFGGAYHDQNFGVFRDADTAYVLSFSILMLNTDLHNSTIPYNKKMTLEQFIESNAGIDGGADLPRDLLVKIYGRIARQEIIVQYDDEVLSMARRESAGSMASNSSVESLPSAATSGWLLMNTSTSVFFSTWSRQWCCYNQGSFYHTETAVRSDREKLTSRFFKIPLDNVNITPDKDGVSFEIRSSQGKDSEVAVTQLSANSKPKVLRRKKIALRASSRAERDRWINWLHGLSEVVESSVEESSDLVQEAAKFTMKNVLSEIRGKGSNVDALHEAAKTLDHHLQTKNIKVKRLTMRMPSNFSTMVHRTSFSKESGGYSEGSIDSGLKTLENIPEPISEGWMRMKFDGRNWRRRYFVLLPDVDGGGTTLFIYLNTEVLHCTFRLFCSVLELL